MKKITAIFYCVFLAFFFLTTLRTYGEDIPTESFVSVCDKIGTRYTAIFPSDWSRLLTGEIIAWGETKVEVTIGDDCMGRCGTHCPGDDELLWEFDCSESNRYTIDCLNHDACVEKYGGGLKGMFDPRCKSIMYDAVDDCYHAPECERCHDADTYCNYDIDIRELIDYIRRWKTNDPSVSISDIIDAIRIWKNGCW